MKYLQRYLSLLFALVMCVGLFSITAHADNSPLADYNIEVAFAGSTGSNLPWQSSGVINAPDWVTNEVSNTVTGSFNSSVFISSVINFMRADGKYLILKDRKFEFVFSNIQFWFDVNNAFVYCQKFDTAEIQLVYDDDSTENISIDYLYNSSTKTFSFSGAGYAKKNVRAIKLDLKYYPTNRMGWSGSVTYKYGMNARPMGIDIDLQTEEASLLEGIGNKLTSGFSALGDKLTNVFNSIAELPQKLWNLISDGLKSLFVPSEESMTAYKDKWDELLASRFGAVYQVVNIMTDSWDGIMQADETDTIEFPQATINVSGTPFSFGGYSVKIVPDGFGVLVTAIKTIVAIVCTVAFVNGMRKRYDEIMGVEQ